MKFRNVLVTVSSIFRVAYLLTDERIDTQKMRSYSEWHRIKPLEIWNINQK